MIDRRTALDAYARAEASLEAADLARAAALLAPFPDLAPQRLWAEWLLSRFTANPAAMEAAGAALVAARPELAPEVAVELARIRMHLGDAEAARRHLAALPLAKGWRVAVGKRAPARWSPDRAPSVRAERNGILLAGGRDWFVVGADGTILIEDFVNANPEAGQYLLCAAANGLTAIRRPARVGELGRGPHVLVGGNGNYYHWLFDFLPRVGQALADPALAGLPLVVNDRPAAFEAATLARLGVGEDRLRRLPMGTAWRFGRLYVPDIGTVRSIPHPATVAWLRATFGAADPGPPTRRLWISRRDAAIRRVANEDAVLAALAPLGFERVEAGGLSVPEQAALFASAEIVAGPHGAALANLVFCRPGTRVVELMPGRHRQADYFPPISAALGLTHHRLHAEPAPTPEQRRQSRQNWDMTIDPAAVVAAVQGIGRGEMVPVAGLEPATP